MPDTIYTPAFNELQARAGVPSIDEQNGRRAQLVREIEQMEAEIRDLSAKYGYTSSYWDAERSVQKSMCMLLVRDEGEREGKRYTEKVLEAMAYAHPNYRKWLDRTMMERADYNVRMAAIAAKKRQLGMLDDEVARATALVRFSANEPR